MKGSNGKREYTRDCHLPASVLARHGRCEKLVVLERLHGETYTKEGEAARQAGIAEHDRFHKEVSRSHNQGRRPGSKKGPCFVASAVYGYDDVRTDELREFRDVVLLRSGWTAWTVRAYYVISPPVAGWLSARPGKARFVAKVLDVFRNRVVRHLMEK